MLLLNPEFIPPGNKGFSGNRLKFFDNRVGGSRPAPDSAGDGKWLFSFSGEIDAAFSQQVRFQRRLGGVRCLAGPKERCQCLCLFRTADNGDDLL